MASTFLLGGDCVKAYFSFASVDGLAGTKDADTLQQFSGNLIGWFMVNIYYGSSLRRSYVHPLSILFQVYAGFPC